MDRFNALGRGAQIMLVAGVLLLIDLFLPWQSYGGPLEEEIEALGGDTSLTAWNGIAGWLLGLLTVLLVAWMVVRLLAMDIRLPLSEALVSALLGGLVAVFGVIKLLTVLGDEQTIWAWIGALLAIAVGVGAWLVVQAAGGIETMKGEVSGLQSRPAAQTVPPSERPVTAAPPPPEPETPAAAPDIPPGQTPPQRSPEAAGEPDRESPPEERPFDPNAPR